MHLIKYTSCHLCMLRKNQKPLKSIKGFVFHHNFLMFDSHGFTFSLNGYIKISTIFDVDFLLWLLGGLDKMWE